jgi:hypothetical protein
MSENMRLWDAVKRVPSESLKAITGGRLKGKSDINPQWRYRAMTEQFGPCGLGWRYEIVRLWSELGPGGQVFAHSEIKVYIRASDNKWSEGIPGIGGSKLVDEEKAGLYANDEGYKMATTDALSVALKMLGVGADVYEGRWDGTRYTESAGEQEAKLEEWTRACSEAAKGDDFKAWWPENKETVLAECGQLGASQVYGTFTRLLKEKKGA